MAREEAISLEFLGDLHRDESKPEEALRYYARAMAIAKHIAPEGDIVMEVLRREAECLQVQGETARALEKLTESLTMARRMKDRFEEGVILRVMARCMAGIPDWEAVRRFGEQSIAILDDIEARHELALSLLQASRLLAEEAEAPGEHGDPSTLVESAWEKAVAAQHLLLKLDIEHWLDEVKRTLSRLAKLRVKLARRDCAGEEQTPAGGQVTPIVAVSHAMQAVLELCDAYARNDEPVLITGETGTGKELVARRVHELSLRCRRPLVAVNVAAIPASMFEREFFGHRKGAFSGADRDLPGYVAEAHGGTLFLDEIADLPLELQPKLLRLLQEGTYTMLGDPEEKRANIRLVAATNARLRQLVEAGRFRRDLYYRLQVLEIHIPPLRERRDDIVPLLNHFLGQGRERPVTASDYFNLGSIEAMTRFPWPGNAREVAVVARRAQICLEVQGRVRVELGIPPETVLLTGPDGEFASARANSADDDILRSRILVALEETGGNRSEAARRLGVARPTLYRWMERYGIPTRRR
jgi:transcriptional regulator with PAS, ATPase and Fis domain